MAKAPRIVAAAGSLQLGLRSAAEARGSRGEDRGGVARVGELSQEAQMYPVGHENITICHRWRVYGYWNCHRYGS
jgi:hypothetical protein